MCDDVKAVWLMIACVILNFAFVLCGVWISHDFTVWARYFQPELAMETVAYIDSAMAACYLALYIYASFNVSIYIDDTSTFTVNPAMFELIVLLIPLGGLILFDWLIGDIGAAPTEGLLDTIGMIVSLKTIWAIVSAILFAMLVVFTIIKALTYTKLTKRINVLEGDINDYIRNRTLTNALAALASPPGSRKLLSGFRRNITGRRIKAGMRRRKYRMLALTVFTSLFAAAQFSALAVGEGVFHRNINNHTAQNDANADLPVLEESELLDPMVEVRIERDIIGAVSFSDYTIDGSPEVFWLLRSDGTLLDGRTYTEVEQTRGMRFKDITSFNTSGLLTANAFAGLLGDGAVYYYPQLSGDSGVELYNGADVVALDDDFALRTDGTAVRMWSYKGSGGEVALSTVNKIDSNDAPDFITYLYDEKYYSFTERYNYIKHRNNPYDTRWDETLAWIGGYRSVPIAVTALGEIIVGYDPEWSDGTEKEGEESAASGSELLRLKDQLVFFYYPRGVGNYPGFTIYVRELPGGGVDCFFSPSYVRYIIQ